MSATYNELLKRLIEERKSLGLSQKEMAHNIYITQSNYSKVEKGLQRLSFEELKYLSKTNIDIVYIFTGCKCTGKYVEHFKHYTYVELCYYLFVIYSIAVLQECRSSIGQWKVIVKHLEYVPLVLSCGKSSNIFLTVRHMTGYQQKRMAETFGVDIKKYRELEKNRCLPDSEIIWRLYNLFQISPAVVLKDKKILIKELSFILESIEEYGTEVIDIIYQI